MSKKLILALGTLLMGFWLSSCSDDDITPDDGYVVVTDPNTITDLDDIIGNWVIESVIFGNKATDSLYNDMNVAFSDKGQVFLSGGAYSTNGTWRLQGGQVSINGLISYKGETNGFNRSASESNTNGGWDTNKISDQEIELYNNAERKRALLRRL